MIDITPVNTDWIIGKTCVLTGGYSEEDSKELEALIEQLGGIVAHKIEPDTDIVIWDPEIYGETIKQKMARQYNGHGSNMLLYTRTEFTERLQGKDVVPETKQTSSRIHHILPYMLAKDIKFVDSYVENHSLTVRHNQNILLKLIYAYNRVTFTDQKKWCQLIAETEGLQTRLYEAAARYFTRIAEYDQAEAICDLAMKGITDPYSSARDKIKDLRVDIAYYRENPFWPVLRPLQILLAPIYEEKDIPHPPITEKIEKSCDGSSKSGSRKRGISAEQLQEIQDTIDAIDYSDPSSGIYNYFVSSYAFNISGIGPGTMAQFIDSGWINSFADIFKLKEHREEMINSGAFKESVADRLLKAIEEARSVSDVRFFKGLQIPHLTEEAIRKMLTTLSVNDILKIGEHHETLFDLVEKGGCTLFCSASVLKWFENETNQEVLEDLLSQITIKEESKEEKGNRCAGKVFVVTGKVHIFPQRNAVKDYIISEGGKMATTVNAETDYLINNDLESKSSKNKKAQSLGIPIISEEQFIEMFGGAEL